ncbi:beta-galactosidase trimerization domain-containing protein [uncultured Sphaerochaeta sp.]|uniref:beta-galactosidase trimerization domain-containing protein n=1 Tax=uncultured Sphaerochaeta sp. TaxID=886478 RepID=UPI002A0A9922|nr:beta-galactosidase trimerization domain-containing protein [uncultured Sphaerochaeta sp.]
MIQHKNGESYWYEKPLRILQTVLREVDAVNYNSTAVVEYMKQTYSNVLVINAGGIFDFFHNPLPTAHIVKQMGGRDILKEISSACNAAGIKVIVRVDFRGVTDEVFKKCPPDWFGKQEDGSPLLTKNTVTPLVAPCYNAYYRNEYAIEFINHLLSNYSIDGIWHNALLSDPICYCDRCKDSFKKATGKDLPVERVSEKQDLADYWQWKSVSANRNIQSIRDAVKLHGGDKVYVAEVFNMFDVDRSQRTGVDLDQIVDVFDFLVCVAFLTENAKYVSYSDLDYPSILLRYLNSLSDKKQPVVLFGGNGTSHRLVMDPPLDTRIWLWETVSLGGGMWNCVFNGNHPGLTHDRRNALIHVDAYRFLAENSESINGMAPYADVAVLYSKRNKDLFGSEDTLVDSYNLEIQGIERVLLENHVQHKIISGGQLNPQNLNDVRVLILPNAASLTTEDVLVIKDFVKRGGNLVSTYKSSLYDAEGNQLKNFSLSEVFGIAYSGSDEDTYKDAYQCIEQADHPLLASIHDTEFIITGCLTAICNKASNDAITITSHVPPVVNQPPEKAWREVYRTDYPSIIENSYHKGKSIYFASQLGKCIYTHGHTDFSTVFSNTLSYLLDNSFVLETNAPSTIHMNLLCKKESEEGRRYILSLINHSTGLHRSVREVLAISDIEIRIKGLGCSQVKMLFGDKFSWSIDPQGIKIHIERLQEFFSIELW